MPDDITMLLTGFRRGDFARTTRVSINIDPAVRDRLINLLFQPEFQSVGFSAFIDRACEVAETAIAQRRSDA